MQQRSSNLPLYKILAIIEKKVFIYLHSLLTAADHYFKKITSVNAICLLLLVPHLFVVCTECSALCTSRIGLLHIVWSLEKLYCMSPKQSKNGRKCSSTERKFINKSLLCCNASAF
jgi:hypothetical protein